MATSDPIGRYYDEGDVESTGPAALAPSAPFGQDDEVVERFGDDDAIVAPAPSPRNNKPVLAFGADDDIVENPANPPRRNGTPERLVPLAPTAQGPAPAFGRGEKIVESPTNPPRVNGTPEHLVPLAPPGPDELELFARRLGCVGRDVERHASADRQRGRDRRATTAAADASRTQAA
jgi:hypothetical protein